MLAKKAPSTAAGGSPRQAMAASMAMVSASSS
jgi:hypothetical protein